MNIRQELLENFVVRIYQEYGYESATTQYHIKKYVKEFGDTEFIKKLHLLSENKSL